MTDFSPEETPGGVAVSRRGFLRSALAAAVVIDMSTLAAVPRIVRNTLVR